MAQVARRLDLGCLSSSASRLSSAHCFSRGAVVRFRDRFGEAEPRARLPQRPPLVQKRGRYVSSTNGRFVIAYIFLVGVPLLCLAAVLKSGRGIGAPISIDGTWNVEANLSSVGNRSCASAVSSVLSSPLFISQSGLKLVVSSAKAKTASLATIDGTRINAALVPATDSGCGSDQTLTLVADVNPNTTPKTLQGRLTSSDCTSCAPIEFRATRQAKPQAAGGH